MAKRRAGSAGAAAVAERKVPAMTDEHKEALAQGREEGRAVRRYLEALDAHQPRRGRRRDPERARRRVAFIDELLPNTDPLTRLHLAQERLDIQADLARQDEEVDLTEVEDDFVEYAASYSARKGISYAAWRAAMVPAEVLRRAGVRRNGS
jgi:hypothetical protein